MVQYKQKMYDNDPSWMKNPTAVRIGKDFDSFIDSVKFILEDNTKNKDTQLQDLEDAIMALYPEGFNYKSINDTSIGGNDAINCYPAFNEDDDIVPPMLNNNNGGMGRIYQQMYDRNQQIAWFTFGVPQYTDAIKWFMNAGDQATSDLVNRGEPSIASTLGRMVGTAGNVAIKLPFYPIIWASKLFGYLSGDQEKVTQYVYLKNEMHQYYKHVNSLFIPFCVYTGIIPNGSSTEAKFEKQLDRYKSMDELPELLKNGPDILSILSKRNARSNGKILNADDIYEEWERERINMSNEDKKNVAQKFLDSIGSSALGGYKYVGFKIEKTDFSESVSTSTGESSLASSLKSKGQAAKDKKFLLGGLLDNHSMLGNIVGGISNLSSSLIEGLTGAKGIVQLGKGNGFFSLPDEWKDTNISLGDVSISLQLRAPCPDLVSVIQRVYLPLFMWIAAGFPRGIGTNMYTSPYFLRGYSTGLFSIPYGIIKSMTIKRAPGEFDWTRDMLPSAIDLDITIENLNPMMFLSIAGSYGDTFFAFSKNDQLQEYLSILSGMGLQEREDVKEQVMKRLKIADQMFWKHTLSPVYLGNKIGSNKIARTIANFGPWDKKIPL
jgi:hypothetical protein